MVRVIIVLVALHATLSAGFYWAMRQRCLWTDRAKTPFPFMMALPFETLWNSARGGRCRWATWRPISPPHPRSQDDGTWIFAGAPSCWYSTIPDRPLPEVPALNRLLDTYGDRVAFYTVYIRAYPATSGRWAATYAKAWCSNHGRTPNRFRWPIAACVIRDSHAGADDGIDNKVEQAYTGWPTACT